MPEENTPPSPLAETLAALTAAYPGLRQSDPYKIGASLAEVRLTPQRTARYAWAGYEVQVSVGHEDHLDRENSDSTALYREVRAQAVLLLPEMVSQAAWGDGIGHVEWEVSNSLPEIEFPPAHAVAAADQQDPRFASAVLATVAKALVFARMATERAGVHAGLAAEEIQWAAECPPDMSLRRWLQQKRRERDTAT
ncbi:hypothetical protein ACH4VR_36145 [Streptomyces sp. NPDC020883]|uniref:hypothetical protein n=1 Tax=Streptomyces sp. NPDC020883 TaxID=3365099 RepID=UPI003793227A